MHRTCTKFNWGAPWPEQPPHMLCKQLVSATQGLQPKLLSSSNALVQLALIQASTLLLLFHLLCSMSSLPHYGSHVRPTKVDLPTPHTDHCLTPLFSHPVRAQAPLQPHSHTLGSSSHWERLGQPRKMPGSITFLQQHDIPAASPKESLQRFSLYTLE